MVRRCVDAGRHGADRGTRAPGPFDAAAEAAIGVGLDQLDEPPRIVDTGLVVPDPRITIRPRPQYSHDAGPLETAINAVPFGDLAQRRVGMGALEYARGGRRRSPPDRAVAQPAGPARAARAAARRLSRRAQQPAAHRPRRVGARPRATAPMADPEGRRARLAPFRISLDSADRHMLVRQSAETWLGKDSRSPRSPSRREPLALRARRLARPARPLGPTPLPPPARLDPAWDHVAPLGRDQYVRVVYPGYLYPFGSSHAR